MSRVTYCEICQKDVTYFGRHLKNHHKDYCLKSYYKEFIGSECGCKACGVEVDVHIEKCKVVPKNTCSKECKNKLGGIKRLGLKRSKESCEAISKGRKEYFKTKEGEAYKKECSRRMKGDLNPHNLMDDATKKRLAQEWSAKLKGRIQRGEWTPNVTNSWCKGRTLIDGKPFRSKWEAAFYSANKHLEYETIRIPYTHEDVKRSYIVDFVDEGAKILYEVKPNSEMMTPINRIKFEEANKWCSVNGYKFEIISNDWFVENYDSIDFENYPFLEESMKQFR